MDGPKHKPSNCFCFFCLRSALQLRWCWCESRYLIMMEALVSMVERTEVELLALFETASLCLSSCRSETSDPFAHLLYSLPHVTSHCIYSNTPFHLPTCFCMPTYLLYYKTIQRHKTDPICLFKYFILYCCIMTS